MDSHSPLLICIVSLFVLLAAALPGASHFGPEVRSSDPLQELSSYLSPRASIYFPNSTQYANTTERYSTLAEPDLAVVVSPATDQDVAESVKFANRYNLPFIAVNQGHGWNLAINNVSHGVSIYVAALGSIKIAADGKTASLGGGVYADSLVKALAPHGKTAATGICGCVGLMGSGLGGGLGPLMGFYGLILDNIVDMTVVLANGSITTVSATSHPDLYWGMRGAGQNFGIVTRLTYKIYDDPSPNWYSVELQYTQDKLERFLELQNAIDKNGTKRKELGSYNTFLMNPSISKKPVILFDFWYVGTAAEAQPYIRPFFDLGPSLNSTFEVPYTQFADTRGRGIGGPICAGGSSKVFFPIGLLNYNITASRAVYNLFAEMIATEPRFNNSFVQFESYSLGGMKAVDPASTAYPHREDNVLVSYDPAFPTGSGLEKTAYEYGNKARAILHAGDAPGRKITTYVSYATGGETLQELYGYEPWRLERLRALKRKYDPERKFDFYSPIV